MQSKESATPAIQISLLLADCDLIKRTQLLYSLNHMANKFLIKKCKAKTALGFEVGIEEGIYEVIGDEPDLSAVKLKGKNFYEIKHSEFQKLKQQNVAVPES